MPTNQEYLTQLATESPDKLKAWFDAEHVDAQQDNNGTCPIGNGTRPNACNNSGENVTDSREKLEADIRAWHRDTPFATKPSVQTLLGWLDRQAAITEHQTERKWCCYEGSVQAEIDRLQRRNDELRTSYDKLKREYDNLADDLLACNREREQLRKHLGIALDHAHDICSLVDIDGNVLDVGD